MIGQKFDQQWNLRKTDPTEAEQQRILTLIRTAEATVEARLQGPRLQVRDLLEIEPGHLLRFDYRIDQQLDCTINRMTKFRGRVVDSHQKMAFLIESLPEVRT
jgi:flagellar motor switch protein FliM